MPDTGSGQLSRPSQDMARKRNDFCHFFSQTSTISYTFLNLILIVTNKYSCYPSTKKILLQYIETITENHNWTHCTDQ